MIVLASMQRLYELMVVLRPDFGVEEKPVRELLAKLLGDRAINQLNIIGKKRLSYQIGKHTEGVYAVALVSGAPLKVGDFEKQLKAGNDVIRYLLIGKGTQ